MKIATMRWANPEHAGVYLFMDTGERIGTSHDNESVYWAEQQDYLANGGTITEYQPS